MGRGGGVLDHPWTLGTPTRQPMSPRGQGPPIDSAVPDPSVIGDAGILGGGRRGDEGRSGQMGAQNTACGTTTTAQRGHVTRAPRHEEGGPRVNAGGGETRAIQGDPGDRRETAGSVMRTCGCERTRGEVLQGSILRVAASPPSPRPTARAREVCSAPGTGAFWQTLG